MVQNNLFVETISIQFFVNCKTFFGQYVYICGNCPQLGNWNPLLGVKLETNRRKYPEWFTPRPLTIRSNTLIQFKFCIIRDRIVTWQGLQQNHYFFAGVKPIQVFSNFNNRYIQILQKNIFQLKCRAGTEKVLEDFESQWGSSIGHSSNYPLQKYYKHRNSEQNRSQISSNLMSITDSQKNKFQQKIFNYFNCSTLFKAISKPFEIRRRLSAKKQSQLHKNKNRNPQSTEVVGENSKKRSYCSLPRTNKSSLQKLVKQGKIKQGNSYPQIKQSLDYEQQQNIKNKYGDKADRISEILRQKKKYIELQMFNSSTNQNIESDEGQQNFDDLFGLQFF